MQRVAFLTAHDLTGFVHDDHLAVAPLHRLGWEVEFVRWTDASVDWNGYAAVVPRSTWDYFDAVDDFLATLERIDRSAATLINAFSLLRWNARKTYLLDLAERGVPIVPSMFGRGLDGATIAALCERLATTDLVVKPPVGANAHNVFRLRGDVRTDWDRAIDRYRDAEFFAQPFCPSVSEEGEYSAFFFDGTLSHEIVKRPDGGDFRAQEEHGARLDPVEAGPELLELATRTLAALPTPPLYARVDAVRDGDGALRLMELELIEPSLYFRMSPGAPERFARAFDQWMRSTQ